MSAKGQTRALRGSPTYRGRTERARDGILYASSRCCRTGPRAEGRRLRSARALRRGAHHHRLPGPLRAVPRRGAQVVAIPVAAVGVLGIVMGLITGRLAHYTDPEDEDEFELIVRRSERLARENLAAEPEESEFMELDPYDPRDFEELVRDALDDLPDILRAALDHVAVIISDQAAATAPTGSTRATPWRATRPGPHRHLPRHAAARLRARPGRAARPGPAHRAPRAGAPPRRRRARRARARALTAPPARAYAGRAVVYFDRPHERRRRSTWPGSRTWHRAPARDRRRRAEAPQRSGWKRRRGPARARAPLAEGRAALLGVDRGHEAGDRAAAARRGAEARSEARRGDGVAGSTRRTGPASSAGRGRRSPSCP